jgi:hypothetical protein
MKKLYCAQNVCLIFSTTFVQNIFTLINIKRVKLKMHLETPVGPIVVIQY